MQYNSINTVKYIAEINSKISNNNYTQGCLQTVCYKYLLPTNFV